MWCYASVFAVGPLLQWGRYGPEPYGTACCIDWRAPNHELSSLSYIVCLFFFCYVLPCATIILSYTCILMTVRGSRQAIQQHVSPQTKTANAHSLIVKVILCSFASSLSQCEQSFYHWTLLLTHSDSLITPTLDFSSPQLSVAVCIGFLGAWSPYAIVAMWAAFGDAAWVPPDAFAIAAILAKSSTIYNPVVYLLCKPNFRECLYKDTSTLRQRIYRGSPQSEPRERFGGTSQRHKDLSISTRLSNGQQDSYGTCLHCADDAEQGHVTTSQRTACILTGSTFTEVTVGQLSAAAADLL